MIAFKWEAYAKKHHLVGCFMHLFYMIILIIYVNIIYIKNTGTDQEKQIYTGLLLVGIAYPALYDWSQLLKTGVIEYLGDNWNYIDTLFIWCSIANVVF